MRLCGYSANGDRTTECQNGTRLTLEEIATQLGTSKRNLQRALRIERNLTDSMKELLDTGEITKTFASDTIASLSEEEQEELISRLEDEICLLSKELLLLRSTDLSDEIEELRKSLKEKGYIGSPILTWHEYIVDGHNRYKMCQELGIHIDLDKNVEEIELGDFAEEIDAMDWMLTHQLSSKNLTLGEKLAMMDEFKEEVRK